MITDFHKDNYREGMKVYLLYTGRDFCHSKLAPVNEMIISEWTIKTIKENTIIVESGDKKIRFRFDKNNIWQEQCILQEYLKNENNYRYGLGYEIYPEKELAEEALRRYKLIHYNRSIFISFIEFHRLYKYQIKDLEILKDFADIILTEERNPADNISLFLDKLPSDIKDSFYRKIWAEHVYEDIRSMDIEVTKKRAEKVSEAYVNGRYDCNLSYWDNLNNLLEEIPEKQTKQECFSLHECLTKSLQTEVSAIHRCSAIDIDFINNDGIKDETQIHVDQNILTKGGTKEAEDLFRSLEKELEANHNRIISCTVVASAETVEELDKLLD